MKYQYPKDIANIAAIPDCIRKLFLLAIIPKSEPNKTKRIKITTIVPKIKSIIFFLI